MTVQAQFLCYTVMIERFNNKWILNKHTGCHNWKAAASRGYGQLKVTGKMVSAHRVSYELFVGYIPKGKVVRHKCDNRKCVNPDHLELGTQQQNCADLMARGTHNRPQGIHNHSSKLTEDQVFIIYTNPFTDLYHREIADIFNVTQTIVSAIKRGVSWQHITRRVVPLLT